jgi:phage-related minor tail protein
MANTPYLVGERGPELFMPNSSGTVLSNQQTRGMGGALVQNFYNPRLMDMTTDYQRAQQEGRKASRAISRGG